MNSSPVGFIVSATVSQNFDGGYSCTCEAGYTGLNCTVNIDDCVNVQCDNGGTCEVRQFGHICVCVVV